MQGLLYKEKPESPGWFCFHYTEKKAEKENACWAGPCHLLEFMWDGANHKKHLKSSSPTMIIVLKSCSIFLKNCHTGWLTILLKIASSDLNKPDKYVYSDKSHNTISLVCLTLSKILYWDNLFSVVQELLCPKKYVGYTFTVCKIYLFIYLHLETSPNSAGKRYQLLKTMYSKYHFSYNPEETYVSCQTKSFHIEFPCFALGRHRVSLLTESIILCQQN